MNILEVHKLLASKEYIITSQELLMGEYWSISYSQYGLDAISLNYPYIITVEINLCDIESPLYRIIRECIIQNIPLLHHPRISELDVEYVSAAITNIPYNIAETPGCNLRYSDRGSDYKNIIVETLDGLNTLLSYYSRPEEINNNINLEIQSVNARIHCDYNEAFNMMQYSKAWNYEGPDPDDGIIVCVYETSVYDNDIFELPAFICKYNIFTKTAVWINAFTDDVIGDISDVEQCLSKIRGIITKVYQNNIMVEPPVSNINETIDERYIRIWYNSLYNEMGKRSNLYDCSEKQYTPHLSYMLMNTQWQLIPRTEKNKKLVKRAIKVIKSEKFHKADYSNAETWLTQQIIY